MLGAVYHVGLTVTDMDRSLYFYRDILGLKYQGELIMDGRETEVMFQQRNCKARVAYLNGSDMLQAPPVELIQFLNVPVQRIPADLFTTSISELCFYSSDADAVYRQLVAYGVDCLSQPQEFDFTKAGFGRSKAFYFRDPDNIILEVMQPLPV